MKFSEMPKEQLQAMAAKGGLAPRVKAPRKEYCNRRHKLEGDNVRISTQRVYNKAKTKQYTITSYVCRQCARDGSRERNRKMRMLKASEKLTAMRAAEQTSVCKKGHYLTDGNVTIYKRTRQTADGRTTVTNERVCKQCARDKYKLKHYGNVNERDHRLNKKT